MTLALAFMIMNPTTNEAVIPAPIKPEPIIQVSHEEPKWMNFKATAYTSTCKGCTGITYTGFDVRNTIYKDGQRIIAVDPDVIPLHSRVEIDTGNRLIEAIALDIGGAIQGNKIDLLVETEDEAYRWGVRDVKVRVVN